MLDRKRALRLRFRRRLRLQRRQVGEFGAQAEARLENDFFKRLERLVHVRRFVASWLLLVILLIGVVVAQIRSLDTYYKVLAAAPGGTYTEGVLGAFTNASPIYATGLTNSTVSKLVFSGLLAYDPNNQLIGDLAESWTVDEANTTYSVKLRPNLTWHDGKPVTAKDVEFTYKVIQNPDARSPLFNSWNSINVSAPDDKTINFTLPNPLASFPYSLTTGIVPKHILGDVPMASMRSVSFNSTSPIGSGPFEWQAIELSGGLADRRQEKIALKPFDHYHFSKPKLNGFVIRTFRTQEQLVKSFQEKEINAIAGLTQLPRELRGDGTVRVYNLPLTAAVMTFFRTQNGILSSTKLRQALVAGVDTTSIIQNLGYAAEPVRQALLQGQVAYSPAFNQAGFDQEKAKKLLDEEGWSVGVDGIRQKDSKPLTFNLVFLNSPEYSSVARQLARQWKLIGVDVRLEPQNESDFRSTLGSTPSADTPGQYDALLYGISVGVDPDVYVYWHSSQIDQRSPVRLNFSQYKSSAADSALESGRTRLAPDLRTAKYQPFLQAWQTDAPALGLYQPKFLYINRGPIYGLAESPINNDFGRLNNVHNWQIREEWVNP